MVEHWHSALKRLSRMPWARGMAAWQTPDQGKDQLQKLARAYKKLKAEPSGIPASREAKS